MSIPHPDNPESGRKRSSEHDAQTSGAVERGAADTGSAESGRADGGSADSAAAERRPLGVLIIAVVLVLEAFALLAAAAWYGYGLLTAAPASFGGAVFMLGLLIVLAAWLLAVGHFLYRGHRWTRAAALVWQLLLFTIAVPTLAAGYLLLGLALLLPPAAVVVLLFKRNVIGYTSRTANPSAAL